MLAVHGRWYSEARWKGSPGLHRSAEPNLTGDWSTVLVYLWRQYLQRDRGRWVDYIESCLNLRLNLRYRLVITSRPSNNLHVAAPRALVCQLAGAPTLVASV